MNVIVVPDFVPSTVTLPRAELLITTSASVAPSRFGSATFLIVPVIVSPTCTFHFVRFSGSPVWTSPPLGRSRLPDPIMSGAPVCAPADGASAKTNSASAAATSHDAGARQEIFARATMLSPIALIAAVPPSPR